MIGATFCKWAQVAQAQYVIVIISTLHMSSTLIEGLRAKRAYIAFLADFHFLQDRADFWQTDLFWLEKHRSVIFSVD